MKCSAEVIRLTSARSSIGSEEPDPGPISTEWIPAVPITMRSTLARADFAGRGGCLLAAAARLPPGQGIRAPGLTAGHRGRWGDDQVNSWGHWVMVSISIIEKAIVRSPLVPSTRSDGRSNRLPREVVGGWRAARRVLPIYAR